MTDEQCKPLRIWRGQGQIISCWKTSWRERLSILIFGRVWFRILAEKTHPPISLHGIRDLWGKVK